MIKLASNTTKSSRGLNIDGSNAGERTLSVTAYRTLWIVLMSVAVCLWSIAANAQQLSASDFASAPKEVGSSWWSPGRMESKALIPQHIGLIDQTALSTSKLLPPTSVGGSGVWISTAEIPVTAQSSSQFRFETRQANPSSMVEGESLFPESFLSVLQSGYTAWESRLEDSGPRTNVNGLLVYPLLQINCAGWHLPISLYIPPLRYSDARR